ncbi:unnamed protein product [Bursaphelenchus xylophilus]|uniref:(pine wood nematode) hypothetical protein n=1 Tax=Bursaphelenchus xylophilus TaxID=6326 RepID=A0A1I7SVE1_BURXY|nr:unnamed protein product [Bursaphelenchus xylophilus]CAG9101310.1 unnamed protein product [Bursaphelenchus xylophilus]
MSTVNWKRSASVVLINQSLRHILMMKRGPTAKFMPNSMVFPGGILEDPYDLKFDKNLTNFCPAKDANISVEEDLGFRICALRELFEEAGILLRENEVVTNKDDSKLVEWRTKVRENPKLFEQMFSPRNLADVGILKPFSRWLTPNSFPRRFDAMFYTIQLSRFDEKVVHCEREMTESMWISPEEALRKSVVEKTISLPPPQFHMLSKLSQRDITVPFANTVYPPRVCEQMIQASDDPNLQATLLIDDVDRITENSDFVKLRFMTTKEIFEPRGGKVNRIVYYLKPLPFTGSVLMEKGLNR